MSYQESLEAAGAKVLAMQHFGSYQGDWWAKVEYEGKAGWVHGYFGSCSGCDAFEAEFGWEGPTPERLAAFGLRYLDDIISQEAAEESVRGDVEWDGDAEAMLAWLVASR